jgi:hypothetical protein
MLATVKKQQKRTELQNEESVRGMISREYWGTSMHDKKSGRSLIVTPIYGCYGHLTTIVITVNGSPTKGTLLYDKENQRAYYTHGDVFKRLFPYDQAPFPFSEGFARIVDFIHSLNIPEYQPMGDKHERIKVIVPTVKEPEVRKGVIKK